eukprot:gene11554-24166_t
MEADKKGLTAKLQIGSVKGPLSYKPGQTVFHHDDISVEKRNRKNEVKEWSKSKLLSADQKSWNPSVDLEKKICQKPTHVNFVKDRNSAYEYNYRAEVLPPKNMDSLEKPSKLHFTSQLQSTANEIKQKMEADPIARGIYPRMTEMPIHPNLAEAKSWNCSTEILMEDKLAKAKEIEQKAKLYSQKKIKELNVKAQYMNPMELSMKLSQEVRAQKKSGTFSLDHHVFHHPPEEIDRKSLKNRYAIEISRKFKTTEHSGRWEFNNTEKRYMWTDTGSYEYDSPGDIVRIHNPDAYNFEGPTLSSTTHNNPRRITLLENTSTASTSAKPFTS